MYPSIETLQAHPFAAILTGHTCGDACWHAREEVCRCSCGGQNHGILNRGGERPQRTAKIDGQFYELAGIIAAPAAGECWATVFARTRDAVNDLLAERFPGIDSNGYGANWRQEKTMPVVDRKVSATQAKWPEVSAVTGACRLIWARPAESRYLVKNPAPVNGVYQVYNDAI